MKIGLALPTYATDGWRLPAHQLIDLARRAEQNGFGGVWVTEHLLKPTGRPYSRLNPIATLSHLAGVTDRIPIGTCILIQPMRNPVLLAEQIATIQHLSGGRVNLGLGIGWAENEYAAVNIPFEERGPRFTEGLEIMTRLFDGESVTYDGEYYQVENVELEPPVPQPPRIFIGGGGVESSQGRSVPRSIKHRISEYGDGWIASSLSFTHLKSDWNEIIEYVRGQGRSPATVKKVGLNWIHIVPGRDAETAGGKQRLVYEEKDGSERDVMDRYFTGTVTDIKSQISKYRDAGFDEVIIGPVVHHPIDVEDQFRAITRHLDEFLHS